MLGEKTNPVMMETMCRSNPLIEAIAIVGHERSVTAAIVQLNQSVAEKLNPQEQREQVINSVKDANAAAPSHSRVVEEMILVLPLGTKKTIPRSPKGKEEYI
jgi:long-subunit acyl-CoA synthetase (AMP-forming)